MAKQNKYEKQAKLARRANKILLMCESKVQFETEEAAFQKGQRSYRCPYCSKWHRSGAFTRLVRSLENSLVKRKKS